ncbi:hypothetical protein [Streptomyces alanosinicus]|uniref:Uncharacterized protein n=1 Tax=Streptomyces alanosinicus TaxID=68171 RepID=A0A918YRH3_9ACTN|nr:hypothetical protein [Streptomyces alanosinicus]GHE11069.1 hypothetical protein GCM10010339_69400 [Streptomyces alanosinicus]
MHPLTVEWLVSQSHTAEFLDLDSNDEFGQMRDYMAQTAASARLVPIRSLGAPIYSMHFAGEWHLIWNENYLEHVFRIAGTLIADKYQLMWYDDRGLDATQSLMSEVLYDEGYYKESCTLQSMVQSRNGLTSRPESRLALAAFLCRDFPEGEDETTTLNHAVIARLYVFLHELGHLIKRSDPTFYAALEREAASTFNVYKLIASGNVDEQNLLSGATLILPPDEIGDLARQMPASEISKALLDELAPDTFALFAIMQLLKMARPDGLTLDEAVYVCGYLFALRLAVEAIRDLRTRTTHLAAGSPIPQGPDEGAWRTFLLRQCTSLSINELLKAGLASPNVGEDSTQSTFRKLNEPCFTLLQRRRLIFEPGGTKAADVIWRSVVESINSQTAIGLDGPSPQSRQDVSTSDRYGDNETHRQHFLEAAGWSKQSGQWRYSPT